MAAINTVCDLFGENYHVICSDDVYGGTEDYSIRLKQILMLLMLILIPMLIGMIL